MTNFERIKNMSVEEMAAQIIETGLGCEYCKYDDYTCSNDCEFGVKKWLESEAEDE